MMVNLALVSLPPPSFNFNVLFLFLLFLPETSMGLFALFNPSKSILNSLLLSTVFEVCVLLPVRIEVTL